MNNNDLNEIFSDTADAIRDKLQSQAGISPTDFATKISEIVGTSNIYKVASIAERDALPANEDDICLVYNMTPGTLITNSVASSGITSIVLPKTFILSELPTYYTAINFTGSLPVRISIQCTSSNKRITIKYGTRQYNYDYAVVDNKIVYTRTDASNDNITFNLSQSQRCTNLRYMNGILRTADIILFNGLYKYTSGSWNYLDININPSLNNIGKNTSVYTSSGIVTGTRNLNLVDDLLIKFVGHNEIPTDETAKTNYNDSGILYYIGSHAIPSIIPKIIYTDLDLKGEYNASIDGSITLPSGKILDNYKSLIGKYNGCLYYASYTSSNYGLFDSIWKYDLSTKNFSIVYTQSLYCSQIGLYNNYIYWFGKSGSTSGSNVGYKINLDNLQASSIAAYPYTTRSNYSNTLIVDNGLLKLYTDDNYVYTYNISSNSWSSQQTFQHNIATTDTSFIMAKTIEQGKYILNNVSGNIFYIDESKNLCTSLLSSALNNRCIYSEDSVLYYISHNYMLCGVVFDNISNNLVSTEYMPIYLRTYDNSPSYIDNGYYYNACSYSSITNKILKVKIVNIPKEYDNALVAVYNKNNPTTVFNNVSFGKKSCINKLCDFYYTGFSYYNGGHPSYPFISSDSLYRYNPDTEHVELMFDYSENS